MVSLPNDMIVQVFNNSNELTKISLSRINKHFNTIFKFKIKPLMILLLSPIDEYCYELFVEAVKYAFDLADKEGAELLDGMINRDYLWRPDEISIKSLNINYFQWISCDTTEREPIPEILSYLFYNRDPVYREPYMFTEREQELRKIFYQKIVNKYKPSYYTYENESCEHLSQVETIKNYFDAVQRRLWRNKPIVWKEKISKYKYIVFNCLNNDLNDG